MKFVLTDNQNHAGESVTVITGGETLSAFEEGLADDDSWVENLSHDDEDEDDDDDDDDDDDEDDFDTSSGEEVTLTCSAAIDQEDELRGYHRAAIDFTLHTIVEESCEDSEVEQTVPKKKTGPHRQQIWKSISFSVWAMAIMNHCRHSKEMMSFRRRAVFTVREWTRWGHQKTNNRITIIQIQPNWRHPD